MSKIPWKSSRKHRQKNCKKCGNLFSPAKRKILYCDRCRHLPKITRTILPSKTCKSCGVAFVPVQATQIYCKKGCTTDKREFRCKRCEEVYTRSFYKPFCSKKCWITKTFKECGKDFESKNPKAFECKECYSEEPKWSIPTSTVGAIAELAVAADLLLQGYEVFRSVSPDSSCDLIAIKGKEIRKIEVRTGRKSHAGLGFPKKPKHFGIVDYAVFIHKTREIVYLLM